MTVNINIMRMAYFFQVLFKTLMMIFSLFLSSFRILGVGNIADFALIVHCKTQEFFYLFVLLRVALIIAFGLQ